MHICPNLCDLTLYIDWDKPKNEDDINKENEPEYEDDLKNYLKHEGGPKWNKLKRINMPGLSWSEPKSYAWVALKFLDEKLINSWKNIGWTVKWGTIIQVWNKPLYDLLGYLLLYGMIYEHELTREGIKSKIQKKLGKIHN